MDLISRQAAIDALCVELCGGHHDCVFYLMCDNLDCIKQLPPIQPEPHWIPCSERLPKDEGFYIVTLEHRYGAETNIRFFKIENGERYWSLWGNENITAWMPKPAARVKSTSCTP